MCYSAQLQQSLKTLARKLGAHIDYPMFRELLANRLSDDSIKVAKALEANFISPMNEEEAQIQSLIEAYQARLIPKLETQLFAQRKRLADAERTLKTKQTKKALEDRRIATAKVEWHIKKLADLKRTELNVEDSRIFPFWYAPVVVQAADGRWIRPMRYHCRPQGQPAFIDRKFDGLYNARRDSLGNFWQGLFGNHHALMVVTSFFENVARHNFERRELKIGEKAENLVLHFNPQPPSDMLVACLWSHWQEPQQRDLYSFAAITDTPPPEVAAAGHDRCIVSIKPENVDAWLTPQGRSVADLQAILEDKQPSRFEHRIADAA